MNARVALIKGEDRYKNISAALEAIEGDIHLPPNGLFIKPNFVSTRNQLAATHVDAVRAFLDFIKCRYKGSITIGEGSASADAHDGYRNFGYESLASEYGVELMDLNRDDWIKVKIYDSNLSPMEVRVAKTVVESPYRVSIGPPKVHDVAIVTLSMKNMVMGSIIRDSGGRSALLRSIAKLTPTWIKDAQAVNQFGRQISAKFQNDKMAMHQGYSVLNLNLYTVGKVVAPHLAIIDGLMGMEGTGPTQGSPVELHLAIASADFLAADTVATKIMGFDLEQVGYLHYARLAGLGIGDLDRIEIVGNARLEECIRPFKPHPQYGKQLSWHLPGAERYL